MKFGKLIPIVLLFLFARMQMAASTSDYGLYFYSHSVPGNERTMLSLEKNNAPYAIKNTFSISFQMWIRNNEPEFGSIFHLTTNENQVIHFTFASDGNTFNSPALVFNESMAIVDDSLTKECWIPVELDLDVNNNSICLKCNDKDTTIVVPLRGTTNLRVQFGNISNYSSDVAPVNVRDIKIVQDGRLTRHWKLWRHDGDLCYDELSGAVASSYCPLWLIDNHIEWRQIYSGKATGKFDVAFNSRDALFYFISPDRIEVRNEEAKAIDTVAVVSGYPAMQSLNHVVYDTLTNQLISYSISKKTISRFRFDTRRWDAGRLSPDEPYYTNHARIFNPVDSAYYFFGGYGFYQYRNELFRLKTEQNTLERVVYEPTLSPRYSSAMATVGNELFIFGGRGNRYGKQEMNSDFYYELCSIDLDTKKSRTLWKVEPDDKKTMLMASSMYFDARDSVFYAVSMVGGGTLLRIPLNEAMWVAVSKPIMNETVYQDCDLSFYHSPSHDKYFVVMDKVLSDKSHDVAIYSINTPLISQDDTMQVTDDGFVRRYWYAVLISLFVIACIIVAINRMRKHGTSLQKDDRQTFADGSGKSSDDIKIELVKQEPVEKYFDRSRSAISLLGTFNVRDKDGNDITSNFTPRLKNLLILLVLYSEKDKCGILTKKLTDILWFDKDDVAARNNRNVTLRKLRVLLDEVGDVEVVSDGGFLRIVLGDNIFCDYATIMQSIAKYNENNAQQNSALLLNQIIEILLYGPLLSNTIADWLDEFKDAYSSLSIDLLKNLLEMEIKRDRQDMIIEIANIMFLHDPLNEEALAAKCSVLSRQGKKGIAKSVYDRFCKEYRESLGENYKIPFTNL